MNYEMLGYIRLQTLQTTSASGMRIKTDISMYVQI